MPYSLSIPYFDGGVFSMWVSIFYGTMLDDIGHARLQFILGNSDVQYKQVIYLVNC